jgi:hypothetical protein
MDNTHQPPDGEPQDFWATQEIRPETGQPGPAAPAEPAGPAAQPRPSSAPTGPASGQASAPWQQPGWGQPGSGQASAPWQQPGWDQPGWDQPGWGQPGSGQPGYPPPGTPAPPGPPGPPGQYAGTRPPRRGRALWWGAGLALVAVLAGGGAFAATHLAGSTSPAAATTGATGATGPTGQAAQLNALLNSASSPSSEAAAATFGTTSAGTSSSGTTAATADTNHPCLSRAAKILANGHPRAARLAVRRCHVLRGVRVLGGVHGQFTFKTKTGYTTLAYERGVIRSISGSDVTVQATDGTTWTWVLVSNTVVRHGGQKVAGSELAEGQQVFAGGPVVSGLYDARLIVIRPAGSTSPTPSSSPAAGS